MILKQIDSVDLRRASLHGYIGAKQVYFKKAMCKTILLSKLRICEDLENLIR